jgi:hypothetical protein
VVKGVQTLGSADETSTLEVHKLDSGDVLLVVYAAYEKAMEVVRGEGCDLNVFPEEWPEAGTLLQIPVSRARSAAYREFEPRAGTHAYMIKLKLKSVRSWISNLFT